MEERAMTATARRSAAQLLVLLALAASGCGRAQAAATVELGPHDKIIVESGGCHAECTLREPSRRSCVVKEQGCRIACTVLPECRPDGGSAVTVCAVVRDAPL
jgi:hypothetical protein